MNKDYQKFKFQRNQAFWLAVLVGLSYLLMLAITATKIFSGFVMQLIFIGNYLKNPQPNILQLLLVPGLVVRLAAGLSLFVLLFILARGLMESLVTLARTRKYLKSLTIVKRTKEFVVIKSDKVHAFTSGFFKPTVYISETIAKRMKDGRFGLSSRNKARAMTFHEVAHKDNFDPLKDFTVNTLKQLMPSFLRKNGFFDSYPTLVELSCDYYAQERLASKKPIIRALAEMIEQKEALVLNKAWANYFLEAADRIKILTGKAHLKVFNLYLPAMALFSVMTINTFLISKTDLFMECDHLADCVNGFLERTVNSDPQNHQGCDFLMGELTTDCPRS